MSASVGFLVQDLLQDLAHLALWVWVQYKSRYGQTKVVWQVSCHSAQVPPYPHMPTKKTPTPAATKVNAWRWSQHPPWPGLLRPAKWPALPWLRQERLLHPHPSTILLYWLSAISLHLHWHLLVGC